MAAAPTHLPRPHPLTTSSSLSGLNQNPYVSSPLASPPVFTSSSLNTNPFRQNNSSSRNTNPFRTNTSESTPFSPVSPIDTANMSEPKKSIDLRTIDGKPYPGTEDKPRKVKVAQDMYAGDMPPSYDGTSYKPSEKPKGEKGEKSNKVEKIEKVEKGHKHTDSCQKCGGHKKAPAATTPPPQNIDCNQCGGKKSTPPSSFPGATVPVRVQPFYPPIQSGEAGPSNARGKHQCTKCGRRKRPESISTSGSNSPQQQMSNHRSVPSIQTNGIPVGINIEPPTAINERAPTFPASSPVGIPLSKNRRVDSLPQEAPQASQPQKSKSHSRSNSISSLFRSLSRRKKSVDNSSPTNSNESRHNSRKSSYTRLQADDHIDRPPSPFSFVDKPQEDQAFEMNDMRRSKMPERRDSWEKSDETTMFLGGGSRRPRIGRSQSTTAAKYPGEAKPVDDVYLSLPPDQRPGITRFKSLRGAGTRVADGLSRSASQIGRSNSLRRLGSVKKVPEMWYTEVDGPGAEYNNYGY